MDKEELKESITNTIIDTDIIENKLMTVKPTDKQVNISIILVYTLTATASKEEVDTVYEQLESLLDETCTDGNVIWESGKQSGQ